MQSLGAVLFRQLRVSWIVKESPINNGLERGLLHQNPLQDIPFPAILLDTIVNLLHDFDLNSPLTAAIEMLQH